MKSLIKSILIFISIALTVSCDFLYKVDCPSFDKNALAWIPYHENQKIIFKNSATNENIHLTISAFVIEHTTHYMTNADCEKCDDIIEINNFAEGVTNLYIYFHLRENELGQMHYEIKGSIFDNYSISAATEYTDYEFNSKVFPEVKILTNNSYDQLFKKLILAKNYGIIGLIDKSDNKWCWNQNYVIISEENIEAEFRDISCN